MKPSRQSTPRSTAHPFAAVVAHIADGTLMDRCRSTLELVQWKTGTAGIAIALVDARTSAATLVTSSGYPAEVQNFVVSPSFMTASPALARQLRTDTMLYSWDDVGFPDTAESLRVYAATDFRNGISVPLRDRRGALIAFVHANTTRNRIALDARDIYLGLRPTLTRLATAVHEVQTAALTRRENEVLRLVRDGYTNVEIARQLFIAERTVATHIENVFRKISASNRVEAAMWACRTSI